MGAASSAPVVVASESADVRRLFDIRARRICAGETLRLTVRCEDGRTASVEFRLWDLPQTATTQMDGRTWIRRRARLPHPEGALPLGYHEVIAAAGGLESACRYIVTPARVYTPEHLGRGGRAAGIVVSVYGLRSARNWGCGDFTDLLDAIDWAAEELHAGFIGLNPLHAIHNRRPFNTSPYLPNCVFYQNFLYLDVEAVEDFARSRRARRAYVTPSVAAEIEGLRASPYVEYERVAALKLRFLKLHRFVEFLREWRRGGPRAAEFNAFRAREGRLLELFAAVLRARRAPAPPESRFLDVVAVAGALPPSRFPGNHRFPPKALAVGPVLRIFAVADRLAIEPRPAARPRPPHGNRPLPRSRPRHRPLRLRPLGPPRVLR